MTYAECLGPLDQEVTTMDLLKRIELRMEFLTQNLERLPLEKVKIAQRVSDNAPTYLLLPLGKWGSKWGDFHWAMGCV